MFWVSQMSNTRVQSCANSIKITQHIYQHMWHSRYIFLSSFFATFILDSITRLGEGVLTLKVNHASLYRRSTSLISDSYIIDQHQFWCRYGTVVPSVGNDIKFLQNSTIKLYKQIILDLKLDIYHKRHKMEMITSCVTSKNSVKSSNLTPHLISFIDDICTKTMSSRNLPEYLIQVTTNTKSQSKNELMLEILDREKIIGVSNMEFPLAIIVIVTGQTVTQFLIDDETSCNILYVDMLE